MDSESNSQNLSKYALRSPLMKYSLKKTRSSTEYRSIPKTGKVRTLETSNSYPGNHCRTTAGGSSTTGSNQGSSDEDEDFQVLDQLVKEHLKHTDNQIPCDRNHFQQDQDDRTAGLNHILRQTNSLRSIRHQWFEKKRHTFAANSSLTSSQDSGMFSKLGSAANSSDSDTCFNCPLVIKPSVKVKPTLAQTISKKIKKLEQLTQEFEFLKNDLSLIVEEEHRLISLKGYVEVEEFSVFLQGLGYPNMSTQSDKQCAYLAYMEYIATVTELREAIESEEASIMERSCRLHREEQLFTKVPPHAVAKMRGEMEAQAPVQSSF